jgi:hypothetical protein
MSGSSVTVVPRKAITGLNARGPNPLIPIVKQNIALYDPSHRFVSG